MIKQSISVKFTFLILIISLTPLLILASYSYLEKTQTETAHIRDILERAADAGKENIDEKLTDATTTAATTAATPLFSNSAEALINSRTEEERETHTNKINEYINPILQISPILKETYIRDTNGNIIYTTARHPLNRTLARETSHSFALKGLTSHSEIIPSAEPILTHDGTYQIGIPVLFISAPITAQGNIIGALTFRIELSAITTAARNTLLNTKTGESYIVNAEGYLLTPNRHADEARALGLIKQHPEFELRLIDPRTNKLTSLLLETLANGMTTNIKGVRDYRGNLVVGAGRKIPNTNWAYIVKLDKTEAYAGITRLQTFLFFQIIISITLISCISLIAGKYITRPVSLLLHAADALKRGKFSFRTHIQTHDELQDLSLAFNRAAQQLGKTETQRKQIDSAKTRFLSITSHELRSPMTPMRAQLQMLSRGYFGKLKPKQRTSVQTVLRNANRLDTILKDFLDISRIEAGRLKLNIKKIDLKKLIQETAKLNENYMPEKKLKITTTIPTLPAVQTDPDRITQVISNLLTNASKFSPPKSNITITAQPLSKHILVSVKDQGIGILGKDQQKLFQPFSQVEQTLARKHQGTGLGLSICKGILSALGGRIWIESKQGKGTTFYFTVPFKAPTQETPLQSIFSANEDTNQTLERAFYDTLGQRGITQFARLQKKGISSKEALLEYVHQEKRNGKINETQAQELSKKIEELTT